MPTRLRMATICLCAALALAAAPARAWDAVGHRIVAAVAERLLTPDAGSEIRTLLSADGSASLVEISGWADSLLASRRDTARWHVVAIPAAATTYDPARDCPNGDCLVERIEQFRRVLADRKADPRVRIDALKWLVHLIGDLHQPMRCIDNGDTLGHEVKLRYFGRPSTLHQIWDSAILQRLGRADRLEARLAESVTREDARLWSEGTPGEWAIESHDLARRVAYGALPRGREPDVGQSYQDAAAVVVEHQLLRAGIRLAGVLNGAFLRTGGRPWWQIWSGPDRKSDAR